MYSEQVTQVTEDDPFGYGTNYAMPRLLHSNDHMNTCEYSDDHIHVLDVLCHGPLVYEPPTLQNLTPQRTNIVYYKYKISPLLFIFIEYCILPFLNDYFLSLPSTSSSSSSTSIKITSPFTPSPSLVPLSCVDTEMCEGCQV